MHVFLNCGMLSIVHFQEKLQLKGMEPLNPPPPPPSHKFDLVEKRDLKKKVISVLNADLAT